jgi:Na+-driven multidrug efflux pump
MVILEFICVIVFVVCLLLYINNIIVDIGSAIASSRTLSPTGADDEEKAKIYAKFRIVLSIIMGVTLGIIICF